MTAPRQSRALSSWKEIAAYLGKGVRTVQRWEQVLGLPVRRPDSMPKGVVFASPEDLDRWLSKRWTKRNGARAIHQKIEHNMLHEGIQASHDLRHANAELVRSLLRNVHSLAVECEALARTTAKSKYSRQEGEEVELDASGPPGGSHDRKGARRSKARQT
jgi:hypothetical protein